MKIKLAIWTIQFIRKGSCFRSVLDLNKLHLALVCIRLSMTNADLMMMSDDSAKRCSKVYIRTVGDLQVISNLDNFDLPLGRHTDGDI